MPPKPKFTKEEIVDAAVRLVSQRGVEGLTARELGKALGSSARPVFTAFRSMEEIHQEVRRAAMRQFEAYEEEKLAEMPVFKQAGMKMVLFGTRQPKLYQLLFMQENRAAVTFEDVFGALGRTAETCIEAIQQDYALSLPDAKRLFENVWIYTFGVGVLCATGVCHFTEEQAGELLTTEFQAVLRFVKSGKPA